MAQTAPPLPWWHRLGHHFSGAAGSLGCQPMGERGGMRKQAPHAQRVRNPAGLAPLRSSRPLQSMRLCDLPDLSAPSSMCAPQALRAMPGSPSLPSQLPEHISLTEPLSVLPETSVVPAQAAASWEPLEAQAGETGGSSSSSSRGARLFLGAPRDSGSATARGRLGHSRESSLARTPPLSPPSLRHPLEIMAFNESTEASIELASLSGCNVIVRTQLDAAMMQRQRDLAEIVNTTKTVEINRLKERQVAWRRKHDALIRRKRMQAARFCAGKSGKSSHKSSRRKSSKDTSEEDVAHLAKSPSALSERRPNPGEKAVEEKVDSLGANPSSLTSLPELKILSRTNSKGSMSSGMSDVSNPDVQRTDQKTTMPLRKPSKSVSPRRGSCDGGTVRTRSKGAVSLRRASHDSTLYSTFYNTPKRQISDAASSVPSPSPDGKDERSTQDISFNMVVPLARKHNLRIDEVKKKWEQFHMFDSNGDIVLGPEEFQKVVRVLAGIPDDEHLPAHLFSAAFAACDTDKDGGINFEEFLLWSNGVQYCEEMMVPDPEERLIRRIAREHDMDIVAVERIKDLFDRFDINKCKAIEEQEFKDLVCELLRTSTQEFSEKRLKSYWSEVNPAGGTLAFKEFAVWWSQNFGMESLIVTHESLPPLRHS